MSFNFLATVASVGLMALGLGWIFAGRRLFKRWSINANPDGLLVGRRLGAVYLGLGTILFLGRASAPSDLRTALCIGMAVVMSALAILGVMEFVARRANAAILVSSAIEVLLVLAFASVLITS